MTYVYAILPWYLGIGFIFMLGGIFYNSNTDEASWKDFKINLKDDRLPVIVGRLLVIVFWLPMLFILHYQKNKGE